MNLLAAKVLLFIQFGGDLEAFDVFVGLDGGFSAGTCSYYRLTIMRVGTVTGGEDAGDNGER